MSKIRLFSVSILLTVFFAFNAYAYIETIGKTTVSPGCEGGILEYSSTYEIIESWEDSEELPENSNLEEDVQNSF